VIPVEVHCERENGNSARISNSDKRSARDLRRKRLLDVFLSVLMLLAFLPLMLVISLVIWVSDGGPILYKHCRVGRQGRVFACLKFRTMATDADRRLEELLRHDLAARRQWERERKLRRDPRVSGAAGEFLRGSSLDELPQLFNVLAGHMSLVGPRPVTQEELPMYGNYVKYYLAVRPGLTGLWQVSGRNDTSFEDRVLLDTHYVRYAGLLDDLAILLRTPSVVYRRKGAY
jgi:lipopolysaccharide/colanic/teichoic acid biosynthesis glycosyltransferase